MSRIPALASLWLIAAIVLSIPAASQSSTDSSSAGSLPMQLKGAAQSGGEVHFDFKKLGDGDQRVRSVTSKLKKALEEAGWGMIPFTLTTKNTDGKAIGLSDGYNLNAPVKITENAQFAAIAIIKLESAVVNPERPPYVERFGPETLQNVQFIVKLDSSMLDEANWELFKIQKDGIYRVAKFYYDPDKLGFPYFIYCGRERECTQKELVDLDAVLEKNRKEAIPPNSASPGQSTPVAGEQPSGMRIFALDEGGKPIEGMFAFLAADCERKDEQPPLAITGLNTMLPVPQGASDVACLFFSRSEKDLDQDPSCFNVSTKGDFQLIKLLIDKAPKCSVPTQSVTLDLRIRRANDKLDDADEEARALDEVLRIGDAIDFDGKQVESNWTVELPRPKLRRLLKQQALDTSLLQLERAEFYDTLSVTKAQDNNTFTIELKEKFDRLAGLDFRPTDSAGIFFDGCQPYLEVPDAARVDPDQWRKAESEGLFSDNHIRLNVTPSSDHYFVPPELADLPLRPDKDRVRLIFLESDACKFSEPGQDVLASANFRTPFSPIVRNARPMFAVIATRSSDLSGSSRFDSENEFWVRLMKLVATIDGPRATDNLYDRSYLLLWRGEAEQHFQSLTQGDGKSILFPSENEREKQTKLVMDGVSTAGGETLSFQAESFRPNLNMMLGIDSASAIAPNARILLIGPSLDAKTACEPLSNSLNDTILRWLEAGKARLATVEMVRSRSDLPKGNERVSDTNYLFRCSPERAGSYVRSYLIHSDGMFDETADRIFAALQTDLRAFFEASP